jgi:hypothetical protein
MGEVKKDIAVARVKVCLFPSFVSLSSQLFLILPLFFEEKCARELAIAKEEGDIARVIETNKVIQTLHHSLTHILNIP